MRSFDFQSGLRTTIVLLLCAFTGLQMMADTIEVDLYSAGVSGPSTTLSYAPSGISATVSTLTGGFLFPVDFGYVQGVGIEGSGPLYRIDGPDGVRDGEVITVEFSNPVILDYIVVDDLNFSAVCPDGAAIADPNCTLVAATAFISASPNSYPSPGAGDYVLQVSSNGATAGYGSFLSGPSTVETVNPALSVGVGGRWKILDPFQGAAVSGFAITGGDTLAVFPIDGTYVAWPDGLLLSGFGFSSFEDCEIGTPGCDDGGVDPGDSSGGGLDPDPDPDPGDGGAGGADPAPIPEPSTWTMLIGALGVLLARRRFGFGTAKAPADPT